MEGCTRCVRILRNQHDAEKEEKEWRRGEDRCSRGSWESTWRRRVVYEVKHLRPRRVSSNNQRDEEGHRTCTEDYPEDEQERTMSYVLHTQEATQAEWPGRVWQVCPEARHGIGLNRAQH